MDNSVSENRFTSDVLESQNITIQNRILYPSLARKMSWEGNVSVEVVVTAEGRAGRVTVVKSSGYDILDRAAADAVASHVFPSGYTKENIKLDFSFRLR